MTWQQCSNLAAMGMAWPTHIPSGRSSTSCMRCRGPLLFHCPGTILPSLKVTLWKYFSPVCTSICNRIEGRRHREGPPPGLQHASWHGHGLLSC